MPLGADAVALTRQLLQENTINPPGAEARAIEILGALLEGAGFAVRRVDLAPGRPNLVARSVAAIPTRRRSASPAMSTSCRWARPPGGAIPSPARPMATGCSAAARPT